MAGYGSDNSFSFKHAAKNSYVHAIYVGLHASYKKKKKAIICLSGIEL